MARLLVRQDEEFSLSEIVIARVREAMQLKFGGRFLQYFLGCFREPLVKEQIWRKKMKFLYGKHVRVLLFRGVNSNGSKDSIKDVVSSDKGSVQEVL